MAKCAVTENTERQEYAYSIQTGSRSRERSADVHDVSLVIEADFLLQSTYTTDALDEPQRVELLALARACRLHNEFLEAVLQTVFARMTPCDALRALFTDAWRQAIRRTCLSNPWGVPGIPRSTPGESTPDAWVRGLHPAARVRRRATTRASRRELP